MLQVRFHPFILYLLHWGLKSLALYFCISCTILLYLLHQVSFFIVNACKMKHWKQTWNIRRVCFMLWNAYKSIVFVQKVKHWNMISRIICVRINCNLSKSCATNASSPGGDASSRRYCQVGARCPNLAIQLHQYNPKGPTPAKWNRPYFFRKTRIFIGHQ